MGRIVKCPEERRQEIVLAACRLFLAKGYENTTMRDVMKELHIAKGTIYHYFTSKDELLDGVIDHIVDRTLETQEELAFEDEEGALVRIMKFAEFISAKGKGHIEIVNDLHKPANAGMHIRLAARVVSAQAPFLAGIINRGCEEGVFATSTPLECAEFILSGVQFLTDDGIYPWSREQLERRVTAFPALIETLLQAPAGSLSFLTDYISIEHDREDA